jgi:hypothetical protein
MKRTIRTFGNTVKYNVLSPIEQPVQQNSFAPLSEIEMIQISGGKAAQTPLFTMSFGSFCSSKLQQ